MKPMLSRALLLFLSVCSARLAAAERKPNLVLILIDDFGFECVTANGGQSYATPNLDRLAAGGMRFENCHVQPLCTPTRAQLMTGVYNVRNYIDFGTLDRKATTFGHLLKSAGYFTGICGKWQLGHEVDSPQHFGFDDALLWQHTRRPPRYANPGLERNAKPLDYTMGEYGPTLINDFALEFVTKHRDEPFFLYYPMILTHDPFQPTPDSEDWDPSTHGEMDKRDNKHFADMTRYMDKMVGRVIAKLEELHLRENTLVLILGDNGTNVGITSRFKDDAYPGGKGTRTARGTHVPMIANWPGRIAAGQVNPALIGSVDFLPTLCEAAGGVNVPEPAARDGRSFYRQLFSPASAPSREWLYSWYSADGGKEPSWEYAMTTKFKLYRDGRFFDLGADPFEAKPLKVADAKGAAAASAKTLQAALDQYADARPPSLFARGNGPGGGGKKKAGKAKARDNE